MSVAALEVTRLSYRWPDGTVALDDVSFTVAPGERVGLVGPNGAGKSTLLLHLNGLLPEPLPAASAVKVFGTPVTEANAAAVRADVGLLFQDADDQLFCPTVGEDVAFGPRQRGARGDALAARVATELARVGLADAADRPPHRLSAGEKRRACLAGVLACDARLLALDEPTSALDPRSRRALRDLLLALPVACLVASHDLEFVVEVCPRVLVLDRGGVVAAGPTREVLDDAAMMEAHGLERPHILRHPHPHVG
jgi:cobalt/nickel transport system ATP-binding protein